MKYRYLWGMSILLILAMLLAGCSSSEAENSESEIIIVIEEESFAEEQLPDGSVWKDINLSHKTKQQAASYLKDSVEDILSSAVYVLTDGKKEWKYSAAELGASIDYERVAESFLSGSDEDLKAVSVDQKVLQNVVDQIAKEITQEPVDATAVFKDGEFTFTEDKPGLKLDSAALETTIKESLEEAEFIGSTSIKLQLPVEKTEAKVTLASLKEGTQVIGEYTTEYNVYEEGRSKNLQIAAEKINGRVVMPGEMFSFNEATEPITEEEGYTYANIISGGEYVLGIGGGTCQVSTTLYVAVILAELEVNERWCHAFPASYAPMGLDATTYEGHLDFCFTNDTDSPVYIQAWCEDGECSVILYGKEIHDPSREVSFYYEIVDTIDKPEPKKIEDPELPVGEEELEEYGHIGYVVETYKTVTENGNSVTEWFSESQYDNSPDKIRVGTKPVDGESSTPPAEGESSTPEGESGENTESGESSEGESSVINDEETQNTDTEQGGEGEASEGDVTEENTENTGEEENGGEDMTEDEGLTEESVEEGAEE